MSQKLTFCIFVCLHFALIRYNAKTILGVGVGKRSVSSNYNLYVIWAQIFSEVLLIKSKSFKCRSHISSAFTIHVFRHDIHAFPQVRIQTLSNAQWALDQNWYELRRRSVSKKNEMFDCESRKLNSYKCQAAFEGLLLLWVGLLRIYPWWPQPPATSSSSSSSSSSLPLHRRALTTFAAAHRQRSAQPRLAQVWK